VRQPALTIAGFFGKAGAKRRSLPVAPHATLPDQPRDAISAALAALRAVAPAGWSFASSAPAASRSAFQPPAASVLADAFHDAAPAAFAYAPQAAAFAPALQAAAIAPAPLAAIPRLPTTAQQRAAAAAPAAPVQLVAAVAAAPARVAAPLPIAAAAAPLLLLRRAPPATIPSADWVRTWARPAHARPPDNNGDWPADTYVDVTRFLLLHGGAVHLTSLPPRNMLAGSTTFFAILLCCIKLYRGSPDAVIISALTRIISALPEGRQLHAHPPNALRRGNVLPPEDWAKYIFRGGNAPAYDRGLNYITDFFTKAAIAIASDPDNGYDAITRDALVHAVTIGARVSGNWPPT
jgi:hypothetical protein